MEIRVEPSPDDVVDADRFMAFADGLMRLLLDQGFVDPDMSGAAAKGTLTATARMS